MKLGIRNQLFIAFGAALLFTMVVGWVGLGQANIINNRAELLYTDDLVGLGNIAELGQLIMGDRTAEVEHMLASDPEVAERFHREIVELDAKIDSALADLRAGDDDGHLTEQLDELE